MNRCISTCNLLILNPHAKWASNQNPQIHAKFCVCPVVLRCTIKVRVLFKLYKKVFLLLYYKEKYLGQIIHVVSLYTTDYWSKRLAFISRNKQKQTKNFH